MGSELTAVKGMQPSEKKGEKQKKRKRDKSLKTREGGEKRWLSHREKGFTYVPLLLAWRGRVGAERQQSAHTRCTATTDDCGDSLA